MEHEILEDIIGLTPTEASKLVRELGFSFRIVEKDGLKFVTQNENSPTRINVKVTNNEVTEILHVG